MKTARLIKNFIDVLIGILTLSLLGSIFLLGYSAFQQSEVSIHIPEAYKDVELYNWKTYIVVFLFIVEYVLIIIGLVSLRKGIVKLMEGDFFSQTISLNFKRTGKLFVTVGLTTIFLRFIADLVILQKIGITLDYTNSSLLFVSIMGLFFMLFSIIMEEANELKVDKELTI